MKLPACLRRGLGETGLVRRSLGETGLVRRSLGEGGFSIVEALIAGAMLCTALVALAHVLAVATLATTRARETTLATLTASQKLEELRSFEGPSTPLEGMDVVAQFERRWSIARLPDGGATTITVEVVSRARTGPPVRLETVRRDAIIEAEE